jgi:hypothetical protein
MKCRNCVIFVHPEGFVINIVTMLLFSYVRVLSVGVDNEPARLGSARLSSV